MRSLYKRTVFILWAAACVLLLAYCKKHKDDEQLAPPVQDGGVYIICEGNYQWSNGRVDYYRFKDGILTEDIFKNVNHRPLGDVVQSMTMADGRGYIVVNNSGRVEVVNMADFSSAGSISGLISPRYLVPLGGGKAYVSDLYSNAVSIVDLGSLQKTGQIPLHGSTEEMLLSGQTVFITNTRTAFIYMISVATNTVTDSIAVGYASNSLRMDKEGKLWVLCAGDPAQSLNASIFRIDPSTKAVIRSFDLGNALDIWDKMVLNGSGDAVCFLNNGVWKLDINAASLPAAPLISQGSSHFYGIGVDPADGTIYVSDAMDYVQKGKVYRYTSTGSLIDSFTTGIIPSGFCFD